MVLFKNDPELIEKELIGLIKPILARTGEI